MEIEKYQKVVIIKNVFYICKPKKRKGAGVVELARLESE